MSFYKFKQDDVFRSRMKIHPDNSFFLYEGTRYYNDSPTITGSIGTELVNNVPNGYISLYELNVDRNSSLDTYNSDTQTGVKHLIRPFTLKTNNAYNSTFKTIPTSSFFSKKPFQDSNGNMILPEFTGSYPMSASISVHYYAQNSDRIHVQALKNISNNNVNKSPHFEYSSSNFLGTHNRDFDAQEMCLVNIPSIFYGTSLKRGSVGIKFFISGTLIAELQDYRKNGELVQVGPDNSSMSGSVEGIVYYNHGIIILSGTNNLGNGLAQENYHGLGNNEPRWTFFGSSVSGTSYTPTPSSSYQLDFKGTHYVPTLTMLCHARKGELNHSNNITYVRSGSIENPITSSHMFYENPNRKAVNIVSSSYISPTGSMDKTTYISTVQIYDKEKNLIAIGKLSRPLKKTIERDVTIKLKMDM